MRVLLLFVMLPDEDGELDFDKIHFKTRREFR